MLLDWIVTVLFLFFLLFVVPVWAILGWFNDRRRGPVNRRTFDCPNCQYSLAGLPRVGTCPECGHAYDKTREHAPPTHA